ncbi:MAG: hypothetical protein HC874_23570 [Richelia sp. SL_2_1]|nr:hypothetical protein [Richelia sp. SL_2_1]
MIKAYLYFQDDVLNIGSCKDGLSIKDYILGNSNQDDNLYIQLHQIPTIGECIYIASSPIELEIVDIYHCVNLPFDWNHNAPCNHVVKLLCKATKLSDWKRI